MDTEHPLRRLTGCTFKAVVAGLEFAFMPMIFVSEGARKENHKFFREFKGLGMEVTPILRGLISFVVLGLIASIAEGVLPGSKELVTPFVAGYLVFAAGDTVLSTVYNIGYHLPKSESEPK